MALFFRLGYFAENFNEKEADHCKIKVFADVFK